MKKIVMSLFILLTWSCGSDGNTNNGQVVNNGVVVNNGNTNNGESNNGDNNGSNNGESNNGTNNDTNNGTVKNNGNTTDCIPSKAQWDATVKDRMDNNCGSCHGDTPSFGAPYGLLDYDELVAGLPGERKVDKIAPRTADYSMPPNGTLVTHQDRDTITEWASCGNIHPDHSVGLEANREPHVASAKPANLTEYTFTADNIAVGPATLDAYECFTFAAPANGGFISRLEAIIDEDRVLHHLVLMRTNEAPGRQFSGVTCGAAGGQFYYAWAPGGDALQFPDNGGVTLGAGETFLLQIHYNNGAGIENVTDNSGVRMFVADSVETEYRMLELGSGIPGITVPPGAVVESSRTCTVNQDMTTFIGFPHMHEIGSEFHESIIRTNGDVESLIDLTGWSFENQPFYDYNIDLKAGDKIKTTCVYNNVTNKPVRGGFRTEDEMCFDFMFVTPATARCR